MDENENPSLWNKKAEDITVGDAVKINLVVVAVMVAIPCAIGAGTAVVGAIKGRLTKRKFAKIVENIDEEK